MSGIEEMIHYYSYQRENVYRTKFKKEHLYSKDTLDIECSAEEALHFIVTSEKIKDVCSAIDVASVLLDYPKGEAQLFMFRNYSINQNDYSGNHKRMIRIGNSRIEIRYPTCILQFRRKHGAKKITSNFIIRCDKGHNIVYPIELYTAITYDVFNRDPNDKNKSSWEFIFSEYELIQYLTKILENM